MLFDKLVKDPLENITLEEIHQYNKDYYAGKFQGSEAKPYNESVMIHFIEDIRPTYRYVENWSNGKWDCLPITTYPSRYGHNYIYVDHEKKIWRTHETPSEFYKGNAGD